MEHNYSSIVPINKKGKALDIHHFKEEEDIDCAVKTFERARNRLLNPPVWHKIAGSLSAIFELYSGDNTKIDRLAQLGDYFRINIVGPGLSIGEGFDWVKVEALEHHLEKDAEASIAMRLRTSHHPDKTNDAIAHFFDEDASSTFIIKRKGKLVTVSYYGRNEVANTKVDPLVDKVRNKLVAAGAEAGLSNMQWKTLIEGFLEPEIGG